MNFNEIAQACFRLLPVLFFFFFLTWSPLQAQQDFNNCVAAFLDRTMIVDEYSTEGKAVVAATAAGELSVRPVTLEAGKEVEAGEKISFRIAIRNGATKTLTSFSNETYREIDLQRVLARCRKGDYVVLITTERNWALPHGEILVN